MAKTGCVFQLGILWVVYMQVMSTNHVMFEIFLIGINSYLTYAFHCHWLQISGSLLASCVIFPSPGMALFAPFYAGGIKAGLLIRFALTCFVPIAQARLPSGVPSPFGPREGRGAARYERFTSI